MKKLITATALSFAFITLHGSVHSTQESLEERTSQHRLALQGRRDGLLGRIRGRFMRLSLLGRQNSQLRDDHQERSGQPIQSQQNVSASQEQAVTNGRSSIRQQLLHSGLSSEQIRELIAQQRGQDSILMDELDPNDLSKVVVLPTSLKSVSSLGSVRSLFGSNFNGLDPFTRKPIPSWFVDLALHDSNEELCATMSQLNREEVARSVRAYDPSKDKAIEEAINTFIAKLKDEASNFKAFFTRCNKLCKDIKAYLSNIRDQMEQRWPEFLAQLNSRLGKLYKVERTTPYKLRLCGLASGEIEPGGDEQGIFVYFLNRSLCIVDDLLREPSSCI